ncbi:unnamed protein product, partial [Adineta steineri]
NGLLLLLELVHIPLYFDLIFCFFDQWWSSDDNNRAMIIIIKIFHIHNSTLDIICSSISILLTTYKQVSIIFAWQLDQTLLNENNDDLALKQNEELIYGTLSHHAQFNNDSNLNIIPSPFIGLARSLITEYKRHRLKLIDLQTSLNNNNQSIFIHTLVEYMIN